MHNDSGRNAIFQHMNALLCGQILGVNAHQERHGRLQAINALAEEGGKKDVAWQRRREAATSYCKVAERGRARALPGEAEAECTRCTK